jgi:hypothetical protein
VAVQETVVVIDDVVVVAIVSVVVVVAIVAAVVVVAVAVVVDNDRFDLWIPLGTTASNNLRSGRSCFGRHVRWP